VPSSSHTSPYSEASRRPIRWSERLREFLRPPRALRPTRAGWYFFFITLAVGFAALNTGNNLLYLVLSLLLSFFVLSGLLSEWALRGIQVVRRIPGELYAGDDNSVILEIHNRQTRTTSFAIVVEDRMFADSAGGLSPGPRTARSARALGRVFALRVGPGESELRRYSLRPERRGPLIFAGFQVSTRFPFGLFLKSLVIEAPEEALAFPAISDVGGPIAPGADERRGDEQATRPGGGARVTGVREFRDGDSMRRVHWRSSIRRGALHVRETEDDWDGDIEVHLYTAGEAPSDLTRFEQRVRVAASQVVAHLEAGRRVSLRTDREQLESGSGARHRRRLLSYLARVMPDSSAASQARAS